MTDIKKIFIHDSEFPLIDSNDVLVGYQTKYPELDPAYIATHCGKSRQETKQWLESLWIKYQPYAEPGFLFSLRKKGGFHSFSWQMYLANVFLDKEFELKPNTGTGPDIQLVMDNRIFWIEAIVTTPGKDESTSGMPADGDIYKSLDPRVARISNALMSKYEKYKEKYLNKICKSDEPLIVAINGTNTQTMFGGRAIEATVFARGNDLFTRNANGSLKGGQYELREKVFINKNGRNVEVATNYFYNDSFKELSAAIYCEQHIINANNFGRTPEGNLFLATNGYAFNPVGSFNVGNLIERLPDGGIIHK